MAHLIINGDPHIETDDALIMIEHKDISKPVTLVINENMVSLMLSLDEEEQLEKILFVRRAKRLQYRYGGQGLNV